MCVSWYIYHTLIYEFVFPNVHFHITHLVLYAHKKHTHTHTTHTAVRSANQLICILNSVFNT